MRSFRRAGRLIRLTALGLLVAAVLQELARPEDRRTWHGRVFGVVPYDLRPPTWSRIREAYWNPADPRLFTDRVLGVGWAVNLYRVRCLVERALQGLGGTPVRTIRLRRGGPQRRP
ncbi:MAG TPA: DUF5808 domain-containing protein [Candidatus Dormibacteraeota bacterium]|jgi:hypothetical protein|nr:DUF5808 domain-containing protein [Candidatus Dormibacteraeota bacterium]